MIAGWSEIGAMCRSERQTPLGVLLKDLKAAHAEGLKFNVVSPFALASVLLFDSMGKQHKPNAD